MPPASVDDLVRLLLDGGLLEPEQRAALDGLQAAFPDPRALARELVQRGWLTPYQVNRLMQGRVEEMLLGPYVLLEGVGEGGMGQVFKARHRVMNRVVALKLIRKEQLDSGAAVQRFRREIQAAGQLAHPNIVMAHDAGQVGERHFLVMEYVAGVDLGRLVRQQGPLAVPQACAAARQAALGLQHAHERGLVHRDVKPSNLLLASDGVVKLLDLGLARPFAVPGPSGAELTQSGVVMGTPDYLAPEQALDPRAVDIRADIYSLGCTLYFLLTGRPPFPTEGSLTQKLLWHQHADPDAVEAARPDVPPALSAVLRRMMARRPADRYQTPGEAAAALVPFCAGPPTLPTALPETVSLTAAPADAPTAPERGWTLTTDPSL
ncbi:MAG: serine/threonine protein kinase, partial [Gemmataceae bacterium]|nr:serine/threonine protein kinase [Gemmataceae bacterium]